ncbi:hypothetical protein [Rhodococcus rhodochrous]|uniref:hypothetical protein n=1 Tax=Rhodococcus rhodochrous TaxID=1829 RepID=UPI001D033CDE|nr:hypothetical protein [Rhodococcus rhodochrous]
MGRTLRCHLGRIRSRRAHRTADRDRRTLRILARLLRRSGRHREGAGRTGRALGTAGHLLQALPVQPLHPRRHRRRAGARPRRSGPADIVEIQLGVPKPVLRTIAEPPASKAAPEAGYHAAFSGPFTVARALLGGSGLGVGHADFTDAAAKDPRTLELARLVTSYSDDRCDEIYPHQFPAVLRVRTRDGSWHEARVDHNRGGPANPLSDDELTMKFDLNAKDGCRRRAP